MYVNKVFDIRNLSTQKLRTWNFVDEKNDVFYLCAIFNIMYDILDVQS